MASSALTPVRLATPAGTVPEAGAPWNWTVPGICFQNDTAAEDGSTRATNCATVSFAGATTLLQPGTRRIVVAAAAPATCSTRKVLAGPMFGEKKLMLLPRTWPLETPVRALCREEAPGMNGMKVAAIATLPGLTPW